MSSAAVACGGVRSGMALPSRHNGALSRPATSYSLAKLLLLGVLQAGIVCARPISASFGMVHSFEDESEGPETAAELWIYLTTAIALVLLGGVFAGLTIALMGQDEIYLQVIATSGEGSERRHADRVFTLLQRGKHWVLVTLLVGNVITNETLPIVLDRSIGGGYAAAISSTVLVIIFGEIVPQSICVRFGLPIGAWMSPFVLFLMWLTAPITWPIAKLLDRLLGEEHGTTYKKAGLKTLVTLHKTMGSTPGDRLNQDEAQIISGVLDLKEKPVGSIMTPMDDVFTLPSDAVLDEELMDDIVREGYSRIPIHHPENVSDFVGMLLVKMLITYDPEDGKRVNEFALATLPETGPDTSCLDIINFFQQGKSHMVLVSDEPGQPYGALGVVTLEDVIEELIGEEIIDESDVYIDVHKAMRRMQPAPFHHAHSYIPHAEIVLPPSQEDAAGDDDVNGGDRDDETKPLIKQEKSNAPNPDENLDPRAHSSKRPSAVSLGSRGRMGTFLMRRKSNGSGTQGVRSVKMNMPEMREALRKLGPSNLASQPKLTRFNTIKVKPGPSAGNNNVVNIPIPEHSSLGAVPAAAASPTLVVPEATEAQEGIGQEMISPNRDASDGVQAVNTGIWNKGSSPTPHESSSKDATGAGYGTMASTSTSEPGAAPPVLADSATYPSTHAHSHFEPLPQSSPQTTRRTYSHSTLGSLHSLSSGEQSPTAGASGTGTGSSFWRSRSTSKRNKAKKAASMSGTGTGSGVMARSGSITESFVESGGGVKKLVLEPTSSSSEDGGETSTTAIAVAGITSANGAAVAEQAKQGDYAEVEAQEGAEEGAAGDADNGGKKKAVGSAKGPKRRKKHAGAAKKKEKSGGDGDVSANGEAENTLLLGSDAGGR